MASRCGVAPFPAAMRSHMHTGAARRGRSQIYLSEDLREACNEKVLFLIYFRTKYGLGRPSSLISSERKEDVFSSEESLTHPSMLPYNTLLRSAFARAIVHICMHSH